MADDTETTAGATAPAQAADPAAPAEPSAQEQFEAARVDDGKRIEQLEEQVASLNAQLTAETKRADDAEAAAATASAKVTQGKPSPRQRKLGPISDKNTLDRDALKQAIAEADTVEIAFSDGRNEVAGTAPAIVEGNCWRDHHLRGLMLDKPVVVTGPIDGQAGFQIAGYALVLDGKQVAYTERDEPLNVAVGQKVNLENDIFF